MNQKKSIINLLRQMASILRPFTDDIQPGGKIWNGTAYVNAIEQKIADNYAKVWWSILETVSDLLEIDDTALNQKHLDYIQKTFLSGMGSFLDFTLDESEWGESAKIANEKLHVLQNDLFELISDMKNQIY